MVVKTSVLKELEAAYAQTGNRLIVLYGRTDSEKELLVRNFVQGKKFFYYRARQVSAEEQCAQMGAELASQFDVSFQKESYEEYFNRIKTGGPEKIVIVIDAFEHIAKKDPTFFEAMAKLRAKRLYPGPVIILLCSSAIAWVEKEMDACAEDAAKRIDQRIKIANLNFLEMVRALPNYQVADSICVYGILGGVPGYVNHWDQSKDLRENICNLVLTPGGYLFDAAENLLSESLRELSVYETILANIAAGYDKLNDLFLKTGFSRAKISVYLKNLNAFDIVSKVVSFETGGWENAKKGVYRISDNYVNFWFHFVYPNLSDLYLMRPEDFYDAYIAPGLDKYMNRYFVEVCMEYLGLMGIVGKLPLTISKMGTWVGKEGGIDIIAQDSMRRNMVGLCNWDKPVLTVEMCEKLFADMQKAKLNAEYYFLFSAKRFAPELVRLAERDEHFILVDMNEL